MKCTSHAMIPLCITDTEATLPMDMCDTFMTSDTIISQRTSCVLSLLFLFRLCSTRTTPAAARVPWRDHWLPGSSRLCLLLGIRQRRSMPCSYPCQASKHPSAVLAIRQRRCHVQGTYQASDDPSSQYFNDLILASRANPARPAPCRAGMF